MLRRPPRSTLFPYTTALPICRQNERSVQGWTEDLHALPHPTGPRCRHGLLARRDRTLRFLADAAPSRARSEEHTSELQSQSNLVCRLLLEKKKKKQKNE